jgi:hypothetical protein
VRIDGGDWGAKRNNLLLNSSASTSESSRVTSPAPEGAGALSLGWIPLSFARRE